MHKGKYVFSQLLDFLNRNDFNYLATKYGGNKYVKQFTCNKQHCLIIFCQLSNSESLRDVVLPTQTHASKANTLDLVNTPARALMQMSIPNTITASSKSLPIRSSPRLYDAE